MTIDNDDDRSLEDVWRDILTRNGVSEAQADDIVTLTFGTPALTRDIPDIEDVSDIVRDALADTEFEAYLDDDANPERIEHQLLSTLEDALDGKYSGPASVSTATLNQREGVGTDGPGTGNSTAAASTSASASAGSAVAKPDRAPAYKSAAATRAAESTLDEATLDGIASVLDDIMTDHDLETEDLYAALERLEENRSE